MFWLSLLNNNKFFGRFSIFIFIFLFIIILNLTYVLSIDAKVD